MNRLYKKDLFLGVLIFASVCVTAQEKVELKVFQMTDGARICNVSSNGKWAAGCGINGEDKYVNPHLWDLTTYEDKLLVEDPSIISAAWDVSNDGVAVGNYEEMPAYYKDGKWTQLPVPEVEGDELVTGNVTAVSDDGRTMVGQVFIGGLRSEACMWVDGVLQKINLPEKDLSGDKALMNKFMSISGDGKIAIGALSYNTFPGCSSFIYRDNECKVYGVDFTLESDEYGPIGNSLNESTISPNGKHMGGVCHYSIKTGPGYYDIEEYDGAFFYDVEKDELTVPEIAEIGVFAIDNYGTYYGSTPINYPIRDAQVYVNSKFESLEGILSEYYDFNFKEESGYEQTGTLMSVSGDGTVIVGCATLSGFDWVLKLPKNIKEAVNPGTSVRAEKNAEALKVTANGRELSVYGNATQMIISDISGKEVKRINSPSSAVSTSGLGAGIYIITLNGTDGNRYVSKVCIK